jgi:hypothetical protein
MATTTDYQVISQVYAPKWIEELQRAVAGWTVTVRDNVTGTVVPVFVPESSYTVDGVRTYVEQALAPVRQVAALGVTAPPAKA